MKKQFQYTSYTGMNNRIGRVRPESTCKTVVLSEAGTTELISKTDNTLDSDEINHKAGLKWISYTLQSSFNDPLCGKKYRATVIANGVLELKRQLTQLINLIKEEPQVPFSCRAYGQYCGFDSSAGKMASLFTGQDAQYVYVREQLRENYPKTQTVQDKVGDFAFSGRPLNAVAFATNKLYKKEKTAQKEALTRSDWSMSANDLMSELIRVFLKAERVKPDAVASHSFFADKAIPALVKDTQHSTLAEDGNR